MGLGQTMITLGMFVLLIMTVISANRMLMENTTAQFGPDALTSSSVIASGLLNEILSKPFDQKVVTVNTSYDTSTAKPFWRQDTSGTILGLLGSIPTQVPDTTKLTVYGKWPWGVRNLISLPDSLLWDSGLNKWYYRSEVGLKDVDDYDGYTRKVYYPTVPNWSGPNLRPDSLRLITYPNYYTVTVNVRYVDTTRTGLSSFTTTRGIFKKIAISITQSPYLTNPAVYTAVATY